MQVLKANSEDPTVISLAIDVVAVANDDHLASQLIEFLLGETDGIPKVSTARVEGTSQRLTQQQTEKILLNPKKMIDVFSPCCFIL
jgi:hypothetical protein